MAKKPTESKDLVPSGAGGSIAVAGGDFFESQAGAGFDNVTAADMLVPRLTILQSLSPQLKPRDAAYIKGAELGQICDVGTGEVFPDGVLFLPVYYVKNYLEWAPRSSGGGLVAIHTDAAILDQTSRNDRNQPILANGNLIQETANFYGFNLSAGRRMCFIPMASTQLKKARKWVTLAGSEKLKRADGSEYLAPLFYRTYQLNTADESNAQGDWSGWTIERGPALPELDLDGVPWATIAEEAAAFRLSLMAGEAKGDVSDMNSDIAGAAGSNDEERM